ncbi:CAP domain-containing protein [Streptomyces peucetius]|uniref:CAP domain-containing protein n=1 Tax=Streptomyces peucetius TaxID=1950 RepID=A0ABY6HZV9_STRPE|nr:CAP domain-containing protein [Streptomyces peucetius]UYQ60254.1 CAP domain-containing protein [Streptomyces peucetius]
MRSPKRPGPPRAVLPRMCGAALLAAVVVVAWPAPDGRRDAGAGGGAAPGLAGTASSLPPAAGRALRNDAAAIAELVNAERVKVGCDRLSVNPRLAKAARAHADDMAARGYYQHTGPAGHDGGDRMKAAGYAWGRWAENIHKGPTDPSAVVADWMRSPAHRDALLDCRFEDMGVGVNHGAGGPWWVKDLGIPRGAQQ